MHFSWNILKFERRKLISGKDNMKQASTESLEISLATSHCNNNSLVQTINHSLITKQAEFARLPGLARFVYI